MKDIIHPICHAGPHILRRIDDNNTIWLCPWPLDSTLLSLACDGFVGRHDFVNFVHKDERKADEFRDGGGGGSGKQHEIDLFEFNIVESVTDEKDEEEELGDDLMLLPPVVDATFTLSAKGFHRSMVRNLVGFVVDIARGLRSIDDIPLLLSNKGGNYLHSCGKVNAAPACGLCLAKVEYEHDDFL
jgi:tRNA U38,U39,U40 pseudouridine synthase TruA